VSNQLQANAGFSFGWSAHTVFSAPIQNTVARTNFQINGGGGDGLSLIAGANTSSWAAIEARLADNNGDGLAGRLFFNASVNAGTWFGGSLFYDLVVPRVSGVMTLSFSGSGSTANVQIADAGSGNVENFSPSGIPAGFAFGTKAGVGYFGNGRIDDFQA
jgi:hypothetical protein